METYFPPLLITYLEALCQALSKPNRVYFQSFIWALLLVEGRKCVTKVVEVCFFIDRSLSSFERFLSEYHWDLSEVGASLVQLLLKELGDKFKIYGAYLVALDTLLVAKASKKMTGVQKWKDHSSNPDRDGYQIAHNWAVIGLISRFCERYICWPILCRLISGKRNPFEYVAANEGIRPANIWDTATALIFHMASFLGGIPTCGGPPIRVVLDAFFSKAPFLSPMIKTGIGVVSRLRNDAVGWEDPVYSGRGRPPKHGRKWKLSELLTECIPKLIDVQTYGKKGTCFCVARDLWIRDVCKKVRIVAIKGIRTPILLISTDLSLSAREIIEIYSSRFSIEIAFRDLKQHFGFGDYQTTSTQGFFRFVHLCCVSFCLWRLMMIQENISRWLMETSTKVVNESTLSFAHARRCLRCFVLSKILFRKFAPEANFEKFEEEIEHLSRIAA
jgi:hypothetical protein